MTPPKSHAGPVRSTDADLIYRNVLDNVASGIMSLDSDGVVTSFNRAASTIVGLPGEAVVGRTFAEVFLPMEGVDEFTEVVLDAVYHAAVGRQRIIEATFAGRPRSLATVASYLRDERGGENVRIGVVAVFSDISELEALRHQELRLARELEAKHTELRDAYLTLEGKNRELSTALKRTHAARVGAGVAVLVLFVALGLYTWNAGQWFTELSPSTGASQGAPGEVRTLAVVPQRISSTITVVGRLAPKRAIEVTSPIGGTVAALHARYGEQVVEGQPLVDLDITEARIGYRDARVTYIKARERVEELEDWSNHVEVSRARRAVSKSRIMLETRENRVAETTFLLERGIIPASEHKAAQRERHNQQLDLQSAEEELRLVMAKGVADGEVAQLELHNARARLEKLEEVIRNSTVKAPVTGVVMHPKRDGGAKRSGAQGGVLSRGVSVAQGAHLLTIGDLGGFTVTGRVDEVDVVKIRPGHPVRITGDAFPGVELRGTVTRVSSQAIRSDDQRSGPPFFEMHAAVEDLTGEQRRSMRLGMSANLEIVIYDKADALVVPIDAVEIHAGRPRLRVRDKHSGTVRYVEVVTGVTTLDAVEIVGGLAAGDEVVISG